MIPENKPKKVYWYGFYEGYESRCQVRLQNDLGVDQAAAETILHLRRQVIELQSHLRQVEAELQTQLATRQLNLTRNKETYFEATWIEMEIQE